MTRGLLRSLEVCRSIGLDLLYSCAFGCDGTGRSVGPQNHEERSWARHFFEQFLAARRSAGSDWTQKTVDGAHWGLSDVIFRIFVSRFCRELFKFKNREFCVSAPFFEQFLAAQRSAGSDWTQKTVDRTHWGLLDAIFRNFVSRAVRELFRFKNRELCVSAPSLDDF